MPPGKLGTLPKMPLLLEPQFSSLTKWGQAGRLWISASHLGVRIRHVLFQAP